MKILLLSATAIIVTASELCFGSLQSAAAATLNWDWNYTGAGIAANGTFVTNDTPDLSGFYLITGITGARNGVAITGLQPAGTPIPGNEPFIVDNLISLNPGQLTGDGFGYSTAAGSFASPFFASFLTPPGYLEVFSAPPFVFGATNFGPEDSELPISFSARITNVPEPFTSIGSFIGGSVGLYLRKKLKQSAK
jgi:hypothetical protein